MQRAKDRWREAVAAAHDAIDFLEGTGTAEAADMLTAFAGQLEELMERARDAAQNCDRP